MLIPLLGVVLPERDVLAAKISDLSRCGPIALQVCASVCGRAVTGNEIVDQIEGDADGCSLLELQRVGNLTGLRSLAVQYPTGLPADDAPPAVVPTVNNRGRRHFVALVACRGGEALIVDLPSPPRWIPSGVLRSEFKWGGEALHFAADGASIDALRSSIRWRRLLPAGRFYRGSTIGLAAAALAFAAAAFWRSRARRDRPRTV